MALYNISSGASQLFLENRTSNSIFMEPITSAYHINNMPKAKKSIKYSIYINKYIDKAYTKPTNDSKDPSTLQQINIDYTNLAKYILHLTFAPNYPIRIKY